MTLLIVKFPRAKLEVPALEPKVIFPLVVCKVRGLAPFAAPKTEPEKRIFCVVVVIAAPVPAMVVGLVNAIEPLAVI